MKHNKLISALFLSLLCSTAIAKDLTFDEALDMFTQGYKTNDTQLLNKGLKELEKLANKGNGDAAYSIAYYYHKTGDMPNRCKWVLKAANLNYHDAYYSAYVCEIDMNTLGDEYQTMEKKAIPWAYKGLQTATSPEDKADYQQAIDEWEAMKAEHNKPKQTMTVGDLMNKLGMNGTPTGSSNKVSSNTTIESPANPSVSESSDDVTLDKFEYDTNKLAEVYLSYKTDGYVYVRTPISTYSTGYRKGSNSNCEYKNSSKCISKSTMLSDIRNQVRLGTYWK